MSHHGRNIDDAPLAGLAHYFCGFARADKRAAKVDGNDPVKVLVLHANKKTVLGNAGIVYQHGQIDLVLDMRYEKVGHSFAVAHIKGKGKGLAALGAYVCRYFFRFFGFADVGENNLKAVTGKGLGNGPANAARTAGHQGRGHSGCGDGLRCAHAHFAFV